MRNIIILCSALLIAVIVLAGKYFSALNNRDSNTLRALEYIPSDAALILNFNHDESFYEIFKDYKLFSAIIGENNQADINRIQKFILQPSIKDLSLDKRVFLSFHPEADSIQFLFIMNLGGDYSAEDLKSRLSGLNVHAVSNTLLSVSPGAQDEEKTLYLNIEHGVALASFSKNLISRCINPDKEKLSKTFIDDISREENKSQGSPVTLFINHSQASPFFTHFLQAKPSGNWSLLNTLRGSSSLSMNYKSDALMFNGISKTDTLGAQYFNIFLHQQPTLNSLKNILPQSTANFIAFGISNMDRFQIDLKNYFKNTGWPVKPDELLTKIQSSSGINLNRDLKPQFDGEFATVENSYGDKFVVIKVKNGRNTNFTLQLISTPLNERISKVNYPDVFYSYFGDPLKSFTKPYFAIADNYLIIANLPGIITNFLYDYNNERILSNSESFKKYDQLVANQSNILYFINTKNSGRLLKSTLKKKYSAMFADESYGLKHFYGLSYQWTADGDHFFSNLYLSYPLTDSTAVKTPVPEQ